MDEDKKTVCVCVCIIYVAVSVENGGPSPATSLVSTTVVGCVTYWALSDVSADKFP